LYYTVNFTDFVSSVLVEEEDNGSTVDI